MIRFHKGQLVRSKSGQLFRVVGFTRNHGIWILQELRKGRAYSARLGAAASFTLIGNNYKAKR